MASIASHYSHDIEQSLLGLVLNHADLWADLNMLERKDFNPVRQRIFDLIKGQLDLVPQQSVSPLILVEKLKSYGQSEMDVGGADMLTYLEGLANRGRMIEKKEAMPYLKELKKLTMKRDLMAKCDEAKGKVDRAETFDEMVSAVDKTLSGVTSEYFKRGETVDLFANMEQKIEDEGNNPDKKPEPLFGPFASFNEVFGSISYPGAMCLVGARSGIGKSSLAWSYTSHVAEKYKTPMIILDAAEMTEEEIQYRAVCAFSEGVIPYGTMENYEWRKSKEYTKIIRDQIWPRVRAMAKTGIYYKNIGGMTSQEIISYLRRFYFNKVGRDNMCIINLDYIKGMDGFNQGRNSSEFQNIGNYVMDLKTLITQEIKACIWTSVQNNRDGVVRDEPGKIIEEHDGQLGLSDRIIQQCTHGFIMRFKTVKELADESNLFGNIKLACIKKRRVSGPRAQEILRPVKTATGFRNNYFNLDTKGFSYKDCGLFSDMVKRLGRVSVDLSTQKADEQIP